MCTATNNASTFTSPQTTFTIFTTSTIQLYRNIIARLSHQKKREKTLITVYKRILIKKSGLFSLKGLKCCQSIEKLPYITI